MSEYLIADTEYGKVRGEKIISEVGVPYIRFLGIPYAKPPVDNLRFQNPIKPSAWEGVVDALVEPPPCAGKNNYIKQFVGSDDCLYLNIYTKNLNPEKKCGTIVYIHGGGFKSGSSTLYSYSPDYILMSDVVFVIFNYRLGPLGFVNFNDKSLNIPGNAGMKDQQMAMRFVRENIQHFGGDPDNITLMGHSSGASSVGLHCLAESSKGLFDKAVLMSGSPLGLECDILQLNWTKRLAEKLGYDEDLENDKDVLDFLNKADVLKMSEVGGNLATEDEKKKLGVELVFAPHKELYGTDSTFLLDSPIDLMKTAWSNDIDIMIGATKDEGIGETEWNYLQHVLTELVNPLDSPKAIELGEKLRSFYENEFKDQQIAFDKFKADSFRWCIITRLIKSRQLAAGKGKTYLYKFAVDSPTQNHYRNRWFGLGSKGVSHADELSYFWKNGQGDVPPLDSMEFEAIKRFTSIFASFVNTGNPNNPEIGDVEWEPVNSEPYKGLIIDQKLAIDVLDETKRCLEFWNKLFEENGAKFC
ncbi:hypothetical protein ACKWTF_013219 [Chironomus riparius]